jgi:hypothetical protein
MSVDVSDLKPKPFKITLQDIELECQPLRLSHALVVAKIGKVFQDPDKATKEQMKQAEADFDELVGELIPDLKGVQLDLPKTIALLEQLLSSIDPADNKELKEKGVTFDSDPKA